MAEFCQEEEFMSFLNELPDLFGPNEDKFISFEEIFYPGFLITPDTPEPNLLMPVQVEDSTFTQASQQTLSRETKIPQPQFMTKSSDNRPVSMTLNASRKRKQTADEFLDDSDSDDAESICSAAESKENNLKFAEQFLAYGIRCKHSFWQYNQESRGPKAKRLLPALDLEGDFHVLNSCIDPAFDSTQNVVNSSSRNKAKHDGGNDLRPDPLKLLHIGSRISGMEEMFKSKDVKNSGKQRKATGREKNILASRICRLRKKAQHEANKIKLEGLQKEQSQLIHVSLSMLNVMHDHIVKAAVQPNARHSTTSLCALLKAFISEHLGFMVAGHTSEFVNRELETVAKQMSGGITRVGQSDGEG